MNLPKIKPTTHLPQQMNQLQPTIPHKLTPLQTQLLINNYKTSVKIIKPPQTTQIKIKPILKYKMILKI